jgi:hypothetical protein
MLSANRKSVSEIQSGSADTGITNKKHAISAADTTRLSEPTLFDAKFFLGHAAKQTGDMVTAMAAWGACLAFVR